MHFGGLITHPFDEFIFFLLSFLHSIRSLTGLEKILALTEAVGETITLLYITNNYQGVK